MVDSLAPFVPSRPEVIKRMLEVARVGPEDVVFDLGCGDGRILKAASTVLPRATLATMYSELLKQESIILAFNSDYIIGDFAVQLLSGVDPATAQAVWDGALAAAGGAGHEEDAFQALGLGAAFGTVTSTDSLAAAIGAAYGMAPPSE